MKDIRNVNCASDRTAVRQFGTRVWRTAVAAAVLASTGWQLKPALAGSSTWTGGNAGTGSAWLTNTNWTSSVIPGSTTTANNDVGTFGSAGTSSTIGINLNFTGNTYYLGGIELNSADTLARKIGDSSSTAGVLTLNGATLNGVPDAILRNASGVDLTIQATQSGTMKTTLTDTTNSIVLLEGAGNIVIDSLLQSVGTTPLTFQGAGSGRVDVTNTGNTFSGQINLNGPEVRFTAAGSFGNASNSIVIDGGRLATASGTTYTLASTHNIFVGSTAGTSISVVSSGTLTYGGVIANKSGVTNGILVKQGGGILALGGQSTYGGDTSINNGTIQLTAGADRLPTTTTLNIGQASNANLGTFDLNGFSQQVAGLNSIAGTNATATRNTVTSAAAATLTLGGAGTYSFGAGTTQNSGVIAGAITLVKSGTGTQSLGSVNTYTGATNVTGGKLAVASTGAISTSSAVTVSDQAELNVNGVVGAVTLNAPGATGNAGGTLSGAGTTGAVSVSGTISPGASGLNSVGPLNTGDEGWNAGGTYAWDLTNPSGAAGTGWDLVSMTALTVNASGTTQASKFTININTPIGVTQNQWYTIAHAATVSNPNGTGGNFDPSAFVLPDPGNGESWQIQEVASSGASGFDVQVSQTPEPGTLGVIAAAAGVGLLRRRRMSGAARAA